MIIHGRKQISEIVYARNASDGGGAIRLSNIIRGPEVVFGGLEPLVKNWLSASTKQAIVAAFGASDGKAVIRATNAYLNQLAATDPTKASALAGFINEDPMMVCSLGLEPQGVTMPIRYLRGDGIAYINTNWYPNIATKDYYYKGRVRMYVAIGDGNVIGSVGTGTSRNYPIAVYQSKAFYGLYGTNVGLGSGPSLTIGADHVIETNYRHTSQDLSLDGVVKLTSSITQSADVPNDFYIYARNEGGVRYLTKVDIAEIQVKEEGVEIRDFLPFRLGKAWSADKVSTGVAQAKDTLGMIDLVTGIFYPNAASSGAFTMEGEPTP